jgi:peptidoglycan/LPS O-acetylase OafA/YrhL
MTTLPVASRSESAMQWTTAQESRSKSIADRQPFLDVLRGIAVIAVILLHSGHGGVDRGLPGFDEIWVVLRHGYLGVQLFFVISGFCILNAVMSASKRPAAWTTFLRRRFRRIFPPYWCSLLLAIGLAFGTIVLMGKSWYSVFPMSMTDWFLNLVLLQRLFDAPDATMVYWSLSIELQYYLVMSVGLLWPRAIASWLVLVSITSLFLVVYPIVPTAGTPLAYWPEFSSGMIVYMLCRPDQFRWPVPLVMGVLTVGTIVSGLQWHGWQVGTDGEWNPACKQLFCLVCALVMWLGVRLRWGTRPGAILSLLSSIGVISYSLYLTHVPLGTRVGNLAGRTLPADSAWWWLVIAISLVVQFVGGWLFFRYFEAPWLNRPSPPIAPERVSATGSAPGSASPMVAS